MGGGAGLVGEIESGEREIRNCQGGRKYRENGQQGGERAMLRSGGKNYIVIKLRSVKLQSGEGR